MSAPLVLACAALVGQLRADLSGNRAWKALEAAGAAASCREDAPGERASALRLSARARQALGDADGASLDLREALRLSPGDAGTALALAALLRERPDEALPFAALAASAAASDAARAEALTLSARLRRDLGSLDEARRDAAAALELAPGDLDALAAMAELERARGSDAAPYATRALACARRAPLWRRGASLRLVARLWRDVGRPAEAYAALDEALGLDPDDLESLRLKLQLRRDSPGARPLSPAAVPDAPAVETALDLLADRAAAAPRTGALDDLALAALDAPAWLAPDAYGALAGLQLDAGRPLDGAENTVRAESLAQSAPSVYAALARRVDPDLFVLPRQTSLSETWLEAAQARVDLGDVPGARASLARGLAVYRGHPQLLRALALLQLYDGKEKDAERSLAAMRAAVAAETPVDVVRRRPKNLVLVGAAQSVGAAAREDLQAKLEDPHVAAQVERIRRDDAALADTLADEVAGARISGRRSDLPRFFEARLGD